MVRGISVKSMARKGRLEAAGDEVRVIGGRVPQRGMVRGREPEEEEEEVREVEAGQGGDQVEAERSGDQVEVSVEAEGEEAGGTMEVEEAGALVDTEAVDRQVGVVNMEVVWRWLYDRGVDLERYHIAETGAAGEGNIRRRR